MAIIKAYSAAKIFTGDVWLHDHIVLTEDSVITGVVSSGSLPHGVVVQHFPDAILAPAFIDLQIYGAYGKLLAVFPEADSLYKLNDYCRSGGAAYCMPTVATNAYDVFYKSIDAIKDYWNKGGEGVLGLHIEGPWINTVRKGAHIESFIHTPSLQQAKELLEYGKGVIKIITLAPEVCSQEVIDLILSYGIVISAGHSNATYAEATNSFAKGIVAVTHLYNAMSPLQHRSPGLVGAAMDSKRVMASIIPDGHHVDYAAIRIAKEVMKERLFVITDAVTETNEGYYPHHFEEDKYVSNDILSGSALTMNKAVQNLVNHAGVDLSEALRMCSIYPAKVIGLERELGKIEKGYKLRIVALDEHNDVVQLIG
jgi:N-acetylglucosamine-6-phosphate deacetylase